MNVHDPDAILKRIKAQAAADNFVVTLHAAEAMQDEVIVLADLLSAITASVLLENYPAFYKGPCCLICGRSESGRYIHAVCSTSHAELFIITVYEPKPPKWRSPTERG
jgi:hypothetical protein